MRLPGGDRAWQRMIAVLYALRVAILASLYLFLGVAAFLIWCESRRNASLPAGAFETIASARLVVLEAGGTGMLPGDVLALTAAATIGRALENTIILPDSSVSARHAELTFRDGSWWIADLGSTNGTRLNDELLRECTRVRPQDVIALGTIRLTFEESQNSHFR